MSFLKYCFAFVLLCGLKIGISQTKSVVLVDVDRLANIDSIVQMHVSNRNIQGAAALVLHKGNVIYNKAFGFKDADLQMQMQPTDIFRIASQTKAITSSSIMLLFDEGKLLLDDPVSKYLPSFKNPKVRSGFNPIDSTYTTVPASREITIRDLLTHTSGIGYAMIGSVESKAIYAKAGVLVGFNNTAQSMSTAIDKIGGLPLEHNPGERFTYGLNTDVLGRIIEVISGMDLNDFFLKRIFTPLQMLDTYFEIPVSKQNRLVDVASQNEMGKIVPWDEHLSISQGVSTLYPINNNGYFSGGAGLVSTVADYSKFLQMILNRGKIGDVRLLSENAVRLMTSNQLGSIELGENYFGFGFDVISERGSLRFGQSEGSLMCGGYWGTMAFVDKKREVIALLFLQQSPFSHYEIFDKFKVQVASLF